jgi:uncharacterized protein YbbC (DUF1343 family)
MRNLVIVYWLFFAVLAQGKVLQGIDQIADYAHELQGKRLAVLAHFASQNQKGEHLVDILLQQNLSLNKIFVPEHGLRSLKDDFISDGIDPQTKLPIISLYKHNKKSPTTADWQGVDAIVIDLKDVGVRYYTYNTSIFLVIQSAFKHQKKVFLLDRINPIGGGSFGPLKTVAQAKKFYSYFSIPMVHGMTTGELMNFMFKSDVRLRIIKNRHWVKSMDYTGTHIPWLSPSPALPSFQQTYLYSIFGLLETFNLAVGRGIKNDLAFRVYGAPWISREQQRNLLARLNALGSDFSFEAFEWKVTRRKYQGKVARGFKVIINNRKAVDKFYWTSRMIFHLAKVLGHQLKNNGLLKYFLGNEQYIPLIYQAKWPTLDGMAKRDNEMFTKLVRPYLLYPEVR